MVNRVIKFRGITIDGVWIYGYVIKQGAYWFIQNDQGGNYPVIENSVGQFTGLHDKHVMEIYEGDILNHPEPGKEHFRCFVLFEDGDFMTKKHVSDDDPNYLHSLTHFKVIGNIYEHPHLLKP